MQHHTSLRNVLALSLIVLISYSFKAPVASELDALKGMLGTWEGHAGKDARFVEKWVQSDASTFLGEGYFIKGTDTVSREFLRIQQIRNYVVMINIVGNQEPVLFTLVKDSDNTWVFENKEHEFPQRVIYSNPDEKTLNAWVEGKQAGKEMRKDFPMKRIQ